MIFRIVVVAAFFGHALAALLYATLPLGDSARGAIYFGSKLLVNAIPVVWIFGVERHKLTLPRPRGRAIALGAVSGLVIGVCILGLYATLFAGRLNVEALREKVAAFGVTDHFFAFAAFLCVVNSGLEEYYWRWFVYRVLRRSMRVAPAAALSALGFTLHHIIVLGAYFPELWLVALLNLGVFAGGVIWAVLYEKTDSLYAPWLSHLLVDAAIMTAVYDLLFRG